MVRLECPEPREAASGVYVGEACGPVSKRAALFDHVVIVGEEYEAEPRAEMYRRLGVDVIVYPVSAGKTPTLVSLIRLLSHALPSTPHEKLLIEGFGAEGVVAAAAAIVVDRLGDNEAASRLLALGHGLTTPLDSRLLHLLHRVLNSSPDWFDSLAATVEEGYRRGFTHGDAHASSVAELAVELEEQLERLGAGIVHNPYVLFRQAVLHPDEPRDPIHAAASALDSTLVGAVKTIHLARNGPTLEVYIGCETLLHQEQCWPEAREAEQHLTRLARLAGFIRLAFIMAEPEEVACMNYRSVDPGLCEEPG